MAVPRNHTVDAHNQRHSTVYSSFEWSPPDFSGGSTLPDEPGSIPSPIKHKRSVFSLVFFSVFSVKYNIMEDELKTDFVVHLTMDEDKNLALLKDALKLTRTMIRNGQDLRRILEKIPGVNPDRLVMNGRSPPPQKTRDPGARSR